MNNSSFTNQQINSEQLSTLSNLELEPLSRRYSVLRQQINAAKYAVLWLLLLLVWLQPWLGLPAELRQGIYYGLFLLPLYTLLRAIYFWQADKHKHFALRQHDISYSCGIFFRKVVTQPVVRVQHIELKQGPLERRVGLARLQLFSAGGTLHTFEIPGLELERAQHIRQFVLQHKDAVQDEQQ